MSFHSMTEHHPYIIYALSTIEVKLSVLRGNEKHTKNKVTRFSSNRNMLLLMDHRRDSINFESSTRQRAGIIRKAPVPTDYEKKQQKKMEEYSRLLSEPQKHLPIQDIQNDTIDWQRRCREIVREYQIRIGTTKAPNHKATAKLEEKPKQRNKMSHSAQWLFNFEKLLKFRQQHKHCHVPCVYDADPSLARWVKRQRYHYYLFMNSKPSPMKEERIEKLEDIGFIWHAQEALWQERLNELLKFKQKYGHCVVPTNFPENQTLATWVKFQRRQYKLFQQGQPSYMSASRMAVLEKYGFQWKRISTGNSVNPTRTAPQIRQAFHNTAA
mmetsp:Transcript_1548/g.2115  ORF Transcript_1548/g.2115 Transcript_1548/m.2115 type:complete len:326 (+) Transcript_1548:48-1025(+)